jgi:hypothetical protein
MFVDQHDALAQREVFVGPILNCLLESRANDGEVGLVMARIMDPDAGMEICDPCCVMDESKRGRGKVAATSCRCE